MFFPGTHNKSGENKIQFLPFSEKLTCSFYKKITALFQISVSLLPVLLEERNERRGGTKSAG